MFSGSIPALVTPFDADGRFVERAFRELIEWQISEGSTALVPCGTTGEAATLAKDEHFAIVKVCVDQVRGRVPVIAGAGSHDTRVAAENIAAAKEAIRYCPSTPMLKRFILKPMATATAAM